MHVLDIYQNYCWSFEADSPVTIRQLRSAAAIYDEGMRDSELAQIRRGKAYRLVGDAACLDLAPQFYEEIRVEYPPAALKKVILTQKTRRWVKPRGRIMFTEEVVPTQVEQMYIPLRTRIFAPAT